MCAGHRMGEFLFELLFAVVEESPWFWLIMGAGLLLYLVFRLIGWSG